MEKMINICCIGGWIGTAAMAMPAAKQGNIHIDVVNNSAYSPEELAVMEPLLLLWIEKSLGTKLFLDRSMADSIPRRYNICYTNRSRSRPHLLGGDCTIYCYCCRRARRPK